MQACSISEMGKTRLDVGMLQQVHVFQVKEIA